MQLVTSVPARRAARTPTIAAPCLALLVSALGLQGCAATVDTTGFWVGTWSSGDGQDEGTILLDMDQDGSAVDGRVKLISDLPELSNLGVEFEGQVTADRLRFDLGSASAPVSFEGTSTEDQISGEFSTPDASGTWSVDLEGTESLDVESSLPLDIEYPSAAVHADGQFWVRDQNGEVHNTDAAGAIQGSIQLDDWCQWGFALDDGAFLCTNGGEEGVQRFDRSSGAWQSELATPGFQPGAIVINGEALLAFHWITNDLAELGDGDVAVLGRVPGKSEDIIVAGGRIWSLNGYPNALFELDQDGRLQEAFRLPFAQGTWDRVVSITFDGDDLWLLLVEEVDPAVDTSGYADFSLVSIPIPG